MLRIKLIIGIIAFFPKLSRVCMFSNINFACIQTSKSANNLKCFKMYFLLIFEFKE